MRLLIACSRELIEHKFHWEHRSPQHTDGCVQRPGWAFTSTKPVQGDQSPGPTHRRHLVAFPRYRPSRSSERFKIASKTEDPGQMLVKSLLCVCPTYKQGPCAEHYHTLKHFRVNMYNFSLVDVRKLSRVKM